MQCTQCNAKWDAVQSVTNCPFCQAPLPVVTNNNTNYNTDSIEGKMIAIVTQFSPEIYNQPSKLNALILDLLNGEEIIGLLKVIIEKKASVECYKLKGLSGNELTVNYNKTLDIVSSSSYIPKETISPALNLLCIGLGLDVPKPMVTQVQPNKPKEQVPTNKPKKQVKPNQPKKQVKTSNLEDFTINDKVLEKYIGAGGYVVIPNVVTSIGENAFKSCHSLTTIVIPNSVNAILDGAFCNSQKLTSVKLPMSITSIEPSSFASCKSLKSIDIPIELTSISDRTFFRCHSLTKIVIPDNITSIGYRAFASCENLTTIDIPNSVTSIGNEAFWFCENLTTINIPNSVTSIGDWTFASCKSLSTIDIPNSVTSIGNSAFASCKSLSTVDIPNSVTSIGDKAFSFCDNLSKDAIAKIKAINPNALN